MCNNLEHDDAQLVMLNLSHFVRLNMKSLYESLMQMPFIVTAALSRGRPMPRTFLSRQAWAATSPTPTSPTSSIQ